MSSAAPQPSPANRVEQIMHWIRECANFIFDVSDKNGLAISKSRALMNQLPDGFIIGKLLLVKMNFGSELKTQDPTVFAKIYGMYSQEKGLVEHCEDLKKFCEILGNDEAVRNKLWVYWKIIDMVIEDGAKKDDSK